MELLFELWREYVKEYGDKFITDVTVLKGPFDPKAVTLRHFKKYDDFGLVFLNEEPIAFAKIDYSEPCINITML